MTQACVFPLKIQKSYLRIKHRRPIEKRLTVTVVVFVDPLQNLCDLEKFKREVSWNCSLLSIYFESFEISSRERGVNLQRLKKETGEFTRKIQKSNTSVLCCYKHAAAREREKQREREEERRVSEYLSRRLFSFYSSFSSIRRRIEEDKERYYKNETRARGQPSCFS